MRRFSALLVALAATAITVRAAVDDFTGYSGSLFGESGGATSGGIAWTGGWGDTGFGFSADVVASALGTVNTESSVDPFVERTLTSGNNLGSTRGFDLQQGQVVYVWGLLSFGQSGGFQPANSFGGIGLYGGTTEKFLIGQRFGESDWGVTSANLNGAGQNSSTAIGNFTTALLLVRIDQVNNDLTFWVNPDFSLLESDPANNPAFTFNYGSNNDDIDTLHIRGGNTDNGNIYQFDNLNISGANPFAIPEPSSMAFVALGVLGLWGLRRRAR
jgi:hypothetical protein